MLGPVPADGRAMSSAASRQRHVDQSDDTTLDGTSSTTESDEVDTAVNDVPNTLAAPSIRETVLADLHALRLDGVPRKDAVQLVVEMRRLPKSVVYAIAIKVAWTGQGDR